MKIRNLLVMMLGGALLAATASCTKSKEPDNPYGNPEANIVSVASMGSAGTTFTYQKLNDSPEITLTTTQVFQDATVKVGQRLMLEYVNLNGENSGTVRVLSFSKCYGPTIKTAATSNPTEWATSPVHLTEAWRTGKWLNMQLAVWMGSMPRRLELVLDPATASSTEPELHLVFTPDVTAGTSLLPVYASFDISSLWDNSEVTALKIKFVSLDGQDQTATLSKGPSTIHPIE